MTATKAHREAAEAVVAWCKKQGIMLSSRPRHIHPRSYIVGRAAPMCLVVAKCWADSEPQTVAFDQEHPLSVIHLFDEALRAGDWCITAYVSTASRGERIAVPLKSKDDQTHE